MQAKLDNRHTQQHLLLQALKGQVPHSALGSMRLCWLPMAYATLALPCQAACCQLMSAAQQSHALSNRLLFFCFKASAHPKRCPVHWQPINGLHQLAVGCTCAAAQTTLSLSHRVFIPPRGSTADLGPLQSTVVQKQNHFPVAQQP